MKCFNTNSWHLFMLIILSQFALYSCSGLKSVPIERITKVHPKRGIFIIHAADSTWFVKQVRVADDKLTGIICNPGVNPKRFKTLNVYAGPPASVRTENNILSLPLINIGNIHNYRNPAGRIFGTISIILVLNTILGFSGVYGPVK